MLHRLALLVRDGTRKGLVADGNKEAYSKDSRQRAREEFLQSLERCAPEVRLSLAQEVLPLYKRISKSLAGATSIDLAMWPGNLSAMARHRNASKENLRHLSVKQHSRSRFELALCDWAQRWNLLDPWLFREVLATLKDWHNSRATTNWANIPHKRMVNLDSAFRFEYPPFDAKIDTWKSYERRAKAAFDNAFGNYLDRAKNQTIGARKAREHNPYHFDWLVEFQINNLSYADIGKKYGIDPSTVHQTIQSTSFLIELTLRNVRRGRKPHRSDAD
jgi:hypothetical protein